jgi:hypothetical protein
VNDILRSSQRNSQEYNRFCFPSSTISILSSIFVGSLCIQLAPIQTSSVESVFILFRLIVSLTSLPNIQRMIILHLIHQCIMIDIIVSTTCGIAPCKCRGRCRYRCRYRCCGGVGGWIFGHFQVGSSQTILGIIPLRRFWPAEVTNVFILSRSLVLWRMRSDYSSQS